MEEHVGACESGPMSVEERGGAWRSVEERGGACESGGAWTMVENVICVPRPSGGCHFFARNQDVKGKCRISAKLLDIEVN